jgi:hypothetical protein
LVAARLADARLAPRDGRLMRRATPGTAISRRWGDHCRFLAGSRAAGGTLLPGRPASCDPRRGHDGLAGRGAGAA